MYDENGLFDELYRTLSGGVHTAQTAYDIYTKMQSMLSTSATAVNSTETAQEFIFTGQSTDLGYFANNNAMSAEMIESIPDANLRAAVKEEFNKAILDGKLKMDTQTGTIKITEKGKDFINKPEFQRAEVINRQNAMTAQQAQSVGIELNGTMQDLNYFRYADALDMKAVLRSGDVKTQIKILENFKALQQDGFILVKGSVATLTDTGKSLINSSLFKQAFGMGVEKAVAAVPAAGTVVVAATKGVTEVVKAVTSNGLKH